MSSSPQGEEKRGVQRGAAPCRGSGGVPQSRLVGILPPSLPGRGLGGWSNCWPEPSSGMALESRWRAGPINSEQLPEPLQGRFIAGQLVGAPRPCVGLRPRDRPATPGQTPFVPTCRDQGRLRSAPTFGDNRMTLAELPNWQLGASPYLVSLGAPSVSLNAGDYTDGRRI